MKQHDETAWLNSLIKQLDETAGWNSQTKPPDETAGYVIRLCKIIWRKTSQCYKTLSSSRITILYPCLDQGWSCLPSIRSTLLVLLKFCTTTQNILQLKSQTERPLMFQLTTVYQKATAPKRPRQKNLFKKIVHSLKIVIIHLTTSATSSEPSSSEKQSDTDSADVEAMWDKIAETQSDTLTDPVIHISSSGIKIRFNLNNEYVYF